MNEKKIKYFAIIAAIIIIYAFGRVISVALTGDHNKYTPKYNTPIKYIELLTEKLEDIQGFAGNLYIFSHMQDDIVGGSVNASIRFDLLPSMTGEVLLSTMREDIAEDVQYYFEQIGTEVNVYSKEEVWTGRNMEESHANGSSKIYYIPNVIKELLVYGENFAFGEATKLDVEITGTIPSENVYPFMDSRNYFSLAGGTDINESLYENTPPISFMIIVAHDGTPISLHMELGDVLEVVVNNIRNNAHGDDEYVTIQRFYVEQTLTQFNEYMNIQIPAEAYDGVNYLFESLTIAEQISSFHNMEEIVFDE